MDLNDYRKEIDRIDDQLIALFARRMETAEKIAEYKKANGLRVLDARREKEKMREILDKTPDDLREYVSSLYSLIFELSRSRQSCLLGTKGDLPAKIAEAIEKTPQLFPEDAASKELKKNVLGRLKSRSQACSEYAPSTPWQATAASSGKSWGVCPIASAIFAGRSPFVPRRQLWRLRLSSKIRE